MSQASLLKNIAETGYNVGFGGRKHWATYDIVEKVPGFIGFLGTAVGIFALVYDSLSAKSISATMAVIGIIGIYISVYDSKKSEYEKSAVELTKIYNGLRDLYRKVQSLPADADFTAYQAELSSLEGQYYSVSISKQILFSDWYAHYKFFWQYQIDWVNEQKNFSLVRDKVPLTAWLAVAAVLVSIGAYLVSCIDTIKVCLGIA
ncbi:SLATT domain-containing protein [Pseudomonas yangonensis]|uniref:SLATT domain-containing protein n=1 Tax=Pseudomonas yangonensis TaxID=2579922 RepID=UPI001379DF44|nr:SLATT domain-containing protein [Pseudomonas yangonensis]